MPVSQLPNLIYIFIIFVYVPHTLYTQSPPLASVHILYHIACRLNEYIRIMTSCASASVATLIISCRLTAPCEHSRYDSLHKCNCRNAHYIIKKLRRSTVFLYLCIYSVLSCKLGIVQIRVETALCKQ